MDTRNKKETRIKKGKGRKWVISFLCRTKTIARFVLITHMRHVPKCAQCCSWRFVLINLNYLLYTHTCEHWMMMMMMILLLLLLLSADDPTPFPPLSPFDPWHTWKILCHFFWIHDGALVPLSFVAMIGLYSSNKVLLNHYSNHNKDQMQVICAIPCTKTAYLK